MNLPKVLSKVWHFRHMSPRDLERVVRSGQLKRIARDSVIFRESEPAAGMFVLLSGKVHLCRVNPIGKEQIISVIDPVIMFNELTAIDGGLNPFTALAIKDCLVWNITYDAFHDLVKRYPDPEIGLGLLTA
jgi:CRP-like cAMP-binding protein